MADATPTIPAPIRALTAAASALLLISALILAAAAAAARPLVWSVFGFELVIIVACGFGLSVVWRARDDEAPLALVCIAGTVGVASILGYVGTNPHVVGPLDLAPWTAGQLLGAALIAALAGITALDADRRAWGRLVRGVLLGLPVAAAGVVVALDPLRRPVLGWLGGLPGPVLGVGGVVGFILMTILLAASVHLTIRAFSDARRGGAS